MSKLLCKDCRLNLKIPYNSMLYIHLFLKFATPLTCYILVVNILAALGVFWNVSNTIMGILILAPANSIGDYVADTALAKERGQV